MEDVEAESSYHGVAHSVLLEEVSRISARLNIEPCAPLVKKEVYLLLGIILVHDANMSDDHRLNAYSLGECIVVFLLGEDSCGAFAAVPAFNCIVVQ